MNKDRVNARNLVRGNYPTLQSAFIDEIKAAREREIFNPLLIPVLSKLLGLHLRKLRENQEVRNGNLLPS
jgi:hypothetical protein